MYMQKKEKLNKDVTLRVQPSLYKKFQKECEGNYKSVSEVIRELMLHYIQKAGKSE
jgi:hypothetical protein